MEEKAPEEPMITLGLAGRTVQAMIASEVRETQTNIEITSTAIQTLETSFPGEEEEDDESSTEEKVSVEEPLRYTTCSRHRSAGMSARILHSVLHVTVDIDFLFLFGVRTKS